MTHDEQYYILRFPYFINNVLKPESRKQRLKKERERAHDNPHTLNERSELLDPPFFYHPGEEWRRMRRGNILKEEFSGISKDNLVDKLRGKIAEYEQDLEGARIGLAFQDLKGTMNSFEINGRRVGWSASTIKVPVMIGTMNAIEQQKLALEEDLVVNHQLTLENYDPVSRMEPGRLVSALDLIAYMILVSDNEATNMLADKVGLENINRTIAELGAPQTMISHLLARRDLYGKAVPRILTKWNKDGSNLTTAQDLTTLMAAIYSNSATKEAKYCNLMQRLLETRGDQGPLSGDLPSGTIVGAKLGFISDPEDGDDLLETAVINRDYAISITCNRLHQKKRQTLPTKGREDLRSLFRTLDEFNQEHEDEEFYWEAQFTPQWHFPKTSPSAVISTLSRVIYDIYYHGELKI